MKTTYLCSAYITVEIEADEKLTDEQIEDAVRTRFFADIETYKKDEVRVEVFEEIEDED